MSRAVLDGMRRNPVGDWTIDDVKHVCARHDVDCSAPTGGGSHYKLRHRAIRDVLTIPARRPIKPFYIRSLVRFVDDVLRSGEEADE